jgi:type IV pilus assembly protein PilW
MKQSLRRHTRGLTLVELLVALVLGLLVTIVIANVFLANKQIDRLNENTARAQESARYAFEILARDLREAGVILCGAGLPVANVLNNQASWWAQWGDGIRGYDENAAGFPKNVGTDKADRAEGTDAVIVYRASDDSVLITSHDPDSAKFTVKVNTNNPDFKTGDVAMACDGKQAALFQITNVQDEKKIVYDTNTDKNVKPGNFTKELRLSKCPPTEENSPTFQCGWISRLTAHAWYIGCNGRAPCTNREGRSLYRLNLTRENKNAKVEAEELAEGVSNMQIEYLTRDRDTCTLANSCYAPASDSNISNNWSAVVAARLTLKQATLERVGTDQRVIERPWVTVVALRNRTP